MKTKILKIFVILVLVLMTGCGSATKAPVGIPGPVGPQGPQGPAGVNGVDGKNADPAEVLALMQSDPEFLAAVKQSLSVSESMPVSQVVEAPVAKSETTQGKWEVSFYEGATDQMTGWFSKLKDPDPALWPDFPNVDNPAANFVAADGLEYGLDESVFMEQNEFGQMPVQARGYRLISGDYNIPGIDTCEATDVQSGCAIAIFNVGEVTADLKTWVRQGFTVPGRYWNGDTLEQAMWGLSSHVSANMLNMSTNGTGNETLNNPNRTNAGANCSVPGGCDQVRFVIAVISGNQLLVKAITLVQ